MISFNVWLPTFSEIRQKLSISALARNWSLYAEKGIEFNWKANLLGVLESQTSQVQTYIQLEPSAGVFPQVKRAHFIKNPEKIKKILHLNRNGEACAFGLTRSIGTSFGMENMLLCPLTDHKRLRSPLEMNFKPKTIHVNIGYEIAGNILNYMLSRHDRPFKIIQLVNYIIIENIIGFKGSFESTRAYIEKITLLHPSTLRVTLDKFYYKKAFEADKAMGKLQEAQDENKISAKEKISSLVTLFNAGIHTTTNFLQFLMAELMQNTQIVESIKQEWDDFLSVYSNSLETKEQLQEAILLFVHGGESNGKVYPRSIWLENCFLEALRLYPIFPDLMRIANIDFEVEELHVQKGDELHLNILRVHQDPSIWEDPKVFRPQRFYDNPELKSKLLTFSLGSQSCIGKHLVQTEAKLFMAFLIVFFDLNNKLLGRDHHIRKQLLEFALCPVSEFTIDSSFKTRKEWTHIDTEKSWV